MLVRDHHHLRVRGPRRRNTVRPTSKVELRKDFHNVRNDHHEVNSKVKVDHHNRLSSYNRLRVLKFIKSDVNVTEKGKNETATKNRKIQIDETQISIIVIEREKEEKKTKTVFDRITVVRVTGILKGKVEKETEIEIAVESEKICWTITRNITKFIISVMWKTFRQKHHRRKVLQIRI